MAILCERCNGSIVQERRSRCPRCAGNYHSACVVRHPVEQLTETKRLVDRWECPHCRVIWGTTEEREQREEPKKGRFFALLLVLTLLIAAGAVQAGRHVHKDWYTLAAMSPIVSGGLLVFLEAYWSALDNFLHHRWTVWVRRY